MFRSVVAVALIFSLAPVAAVAQKAPAGETISGRVVDQSSGLAIAGARVESIGPADSAVLTDANGRFVMSGLTGGTYQLRISHTGYQSTVSDSITLYPGVTAVVTLAILSQKTGASGLRTIGHTTTRASESLQRSSVIYQSVSAETIQNLGSFRASDYLTTLPQINVASGTSGGSDTPSPGDDQYLDFRGVGNLETTTLLDGHPIGSGLNRGKNYGYNWESSPTFALRNIVVTYGSGLNGLSPYSAIGGVANMITLDPTPERQFSFTQGYGSFSKLVSTGSATGMITPRLGYALAGGTQGIDGPYSHDSFYQPAAAYDQAAPVGSKVYNLGIYPYDTAVTNRGGLAKLQYGFGDPAHLSHLTGSAVWSSYWDNKTGNGDQDYLPFDTALAMGNALLASYTPGKPTEAPYTVTNLPNCPKGTFLGSSLNGNPYGFGPNGLPDGGVHCVTPKQYAALASGWQGAGTTWQAFHQAQYDLKLDTPTKNGQIVLDGFTNTWYQMYDRSFELPWNKATGPSGAGYAPNPYWTSPAVSISGFTATDQSFWKDSDLGIGFAYNNYAYVLQTFGTPASTPIVHDQSTYLQYAYHPTLANFVAYLNAAETWSTVTNTWTFNPRLALVYNVTPRDVLRVAAGSAATNPYASQVFTPASLVAPGSLPGNINCSGLTIIGSVGNPTLVPEKANDVDVSYGHKFGGDSQIQASIYSENVNDKLFAEPINVTTLPAGFINTTPYQTVVKSQCGGAAGTGQLGVNSQANIGRLLAQGVDIGGRQRVNRRLFFDYDYSIETAVLKSADLLLLQNNPTYIIGAQLPGVPVHKWLLAADWTLARNADLRYTQYYLGTNNAKNVPAYNYGELSLNVPFQSGRLNVAVDNVFNQYVQWNGYIGHGIPLAMNQYATAAQYAPLTGANATEAYGLPTRQIYFAYTFQPRM